MKRDTLLVIGARGQYGAGLTRTLRKMHGPLRVIAADRDPANLGRSNEEPYEQVDLTDKASLAGIISRYDITQIYLLSSMGTATTESLRNVLELAVEKGIAKVFWPGTVSVLGTAGEGPVEGPTRQKCLQTDAVNPVTDYGVSAAAKEYWSHYFWSQHKLDVRSLRFPGMISSKPLPGGDDVFEYVPAMFHAALQGQPYTCYLHEDTALPMIYLPDAVRATLELMEAPASAISVRSGYNIDAMSFTPGELARTIQRYVPNLQVRYEPDHRESIAQRLPASVDDSVAAAGWGWEFAFSLQETVRHMLRELSSGMDLKPEQLRQMQLPVYF